MRIAPVIAVAVCAIAAGVSAQPTDPIGQAIDKAKDGPAAEKAEQPPPAPGEIPVNAAPVVEAVNAQVAAEAANVAVAPAAPTPQVVERRPRYPRAIIQALDKVTAESMRFEVEVKKPVRYGDLVFTLNACEATAPGERVRDAMAYLEIVSRPKAVPGRAQPVEKNVFKGWVFAGSPSVNPIEHSVYDAWLIACKA